MRRSHLMFQTSFSFLIPDKPICFFGGAHNVFPFVLPTRRQTLPSWSSFLQLQRRLMLPSSRLDPDPAPALLLMVRCHILSRWWTRWVVLLPWWWHLIGCFEADGLRHIAVGIQTLWAEQQAKVKAEESVLWRMFACDIRVLHESF